MAELWRYSAAELNAGFAGGEFTPVDALEACMARVRQCEPQLNAFIHLDDGGARTAAVASRDRWVRGKPLGSLDGVPISLKDNLHAAGLPTTWGSRLLNDFVAPKDELPVAHLRAAGAVIIGKTNLPEFAMQGYTSNLIAGVTRNPWNPALTPGGSSGGAAAAVAAGCGPLALATDGGGSIRRPASHCGLVGFKPSAGLVPRAGGLPNIFLDYEVAGAIGRTVQDVAQLVRIIASPRNAPAPDLHSPSRVLFVPRIGAHPVDPGIAAQVRAAAAKVAAIGHVVEEAPTFDLADDVDARWPVLSCAGLAWLLRDARRWPEFALLAHSALDTGQCTAAAQANLRAGLATEATALFELFASVHALRQRLALEVFADHDFILTPATAALPWPAEETHPAHIDGHAVGPRGHAVFTAFVNAAGLPAVALPTGLVRGMPAGLQLVGKPGADAEVLALARQFESAHPWSGMWPELVPAVSRRAQV